MLPSDNRRSERISAFSPLDAVQAWLDGNFHFGEEDALIEAIRRDGRITVSDYDISESIINSIEHELDAAAALERLAAAAQP